MKKILISLVIIILTFPSMWILLKPGYFSMHDDLQVMRIYELERCFSDGQIPCRWAPDMAYGYGQPMFNFYSAFPYYLGAFIRMVTPLSIMATVRVLFLISILGSAFGMFFLVRRFYGNLGGILSSMAYTYAPYHALDIYVRGALSESFALMILPYIFLFTYFIIEKVTLKRIIFLSLSLYVLFTSHNISTLIYFPYVVVWVLFWIVFLKKWKSIYALGFSLILGFGLSAFFLLPNLFEQTLIQKESLISDYYFYPSHFVSLKQLFLERDWGYGPSTFGPNDEMSLQIGWPYWQLGIILGLLTLLSVKKKMKITNLLTLVILAMGGISAYLTHQRSFFIWEAIPILSYVQFPWRFLGLTIFFLSFSLGMLVSGKAILKIIIFVLTLLLIISLNASYFKPEHYWFWATDREKLTGIQFELQQKAAILDYLPKTAKSAPQGKPPQNPEIISGKGIIENFSNRSNNFFFDAVVHEKAEIQIPVTYFPGWIVIVEGKEIPSYSSGDLGLVTIDLDRGNYIVHGRFVDTPIRFIGNSISALTFLLILSVIILTDSNKSVLRSYGNA